MIEADHMQHAMDHETRQLFANRDSVVRRVPSRDVWRDVDVADKRCATGSTRQCERDDIGGTLMTQVLLVEGGDSTSADEGDREPRVANSLGFQNAARE